MMQREFSPLIYGRLDIPEGETLCQALREYSLPVVDAMGAIRLERFLDVAMLADDELRSVSAGAFVPLSCAARESV